MCFFLYESLHEITTLPIKCFCFSFSMEWKGQGRVLVQLLMLVCVLEVSLCQHWSYGWLPGGKRSVGEVEATFRVRLSSCPLLFAVILKKFFFFLIKYGRPGVTRGGKN